MLKMLSNIQSNFFLIIGYIESFKSPHSRQLFLPQLLYQIAKKLAIRGDFPLYNTIKSSFLIKTLDSNIYFDFLTILAIVIEKNNRISSASSNKNSDILEVIKNKIFLYKGFKNKL